MKKGCFVKVIIVVTILTAAILYILQNHFDELILNPGKNIIKDFVISDFDDQFLFVKESAEKDSLRLILGELVEMQITDEKEMSNKEFDWILDSVKQFVDDSVLSNKEYLHIKELINDYSSK